MELENRVLQAADAVIEDKLAYKINTALVK